jgi:hypothetical protein
MSWSFDPILQWYISNTQGLYSALRPRQIRPRHRYMQRTSIPGAFNSVALTLSG